MSRDKIWKLATLLVSSYLMIAIIPEVRVLGFLISSIGLDTLFVLVQVQLIIWFGSFYTFQFLPVVRSTNQFFEKHDPFFFMPSIGQLKACPKMLFHGFPFMITVFIIMFADQS